MVHEHFSKPRNGWYFVAHVVQGHANLERDEHDDDPLERVTLPILQNFQIKFHLGLNEVELVIQVLETVFEFEILSKAFPDDVILRVLPRGVGASQQTEFGDELRECVVVLGNQREQTLFTNIQITGQFGALVEFTKNLHHTIDFLLVVFQCHRLRQDA